LTSYEWPDTYRIVCADPLPDKLRALLEQEITQGSFACPKSPNDDELRSLASDADVLLTKGRAIDRELLEALEGRLSLVHVLGRYPDRVDVRAAKAAGVTVATMPHGGAMAVADHTLALVLAVARKIVPGHQGVVDAAYEEHGRTPAPTTEWSFAFNWLGFPDVVEINRKSIGLVGFGEIGKEVARRARGFDMHVSYYRRTPLANGWEEKLGVHYCELDELIESSDVVSLHAPHTPETENLINEDRLRRMKVTAILVNTSRGGLVDETTLVRALEDGRIGGAGLDVFVEEPLPRDHPLTHAPNVVLAPHTGGGSGGGQKKVFSEVLKNVSRFARGERLHHVVELEDVP
jgi:phosphoglycerate dehydrogenase-like enzyme